MSRTKTRGGRRLRIAIASATAAVAVTAFGASSAGAATITLDDGYLKISGQETANHIIDSPPGAPVQLNNVTYDGGGNFSVTPANFDFPPFMGDVSGVDLTVDVNALQTMNGNYNAATGVLTTSATNFEANIALGAPINANCTISPIPLAMSTADNSIFKGDVFNAGADPISGAITDDWASLPPDNDPSCGLINGLTAGPGALWLSNGIAAPTLTPPPAGNPPAPQPKPKAKKCKKKKKGKKGAAAAKKCKTKKKKKK